MDRIGARGGPGRLGIALLLVIGAGLAPRGAAAQQPEPAGLRVYLDCQDRVPGCDFDYLRTEMDWIEWVRNRQDAAVHVLVTTDETGGGGRAYTMRLIGRNGFLGRADTLHFSSPPSTTDDENRQRFARWLRIGLVPFVARTALAPGLDVAYTGDIHAGAATGVAVDPWNAWVFRLRAGTSLEGESLQKSTSLEGSVDVNRVTPEWKTELGLESNYDDSRYTLEDGSTTRAVQRSYRLDGMNVKALGAHWSAGLVGSLSSSTYSNISLAARVAPGIEYDVFPYDESTRRQLTILYTLGPAYRTYDEVTLYGKTRDRLLDHTLNVALSLRQPWGSIYSSVEGRQILHWTPDAPTPEAQAQADAAKYRITWRGDVEVNLLRGLSLDVRGRYSRVHDQISLPAEGASNEEILLRLTELQTDFTYRLSVGLSYTFGSIHNAIVNPRFDAY